MQMDAVREYHVKLVQDGLLPPDHAFVLVQFNGTLWMVIEETHLSAEVLEDAWTVLRETACWPRAGHVSTPPPAYS